MLFSGLSEAGWGGFGGSGVGLIEILLIAALGYLIYRSVRRPALETGYGTMPYQGSAYSSGYSAPAPEAPTSTEPDFSSIRTMDASFDPGRFIKSAQDIFFKVQAAWSRQDTVNLNSLCAPELAREWAQEVVERHARGEKNIIENIALRASEITEAWTEQGQNYVTVRFEATLLDYTIDERSGSVITGSRSEPVEFEEFWTFTRPVGPNPWKLTAVQQP
jgi:predicted lipid-binding transport protein (Tim44 family)